MPIAAVPYESEHLHSLLFHERSPSASAEPHTTDRLFTIRAADSDGRRSSARILVDRMYATRGYSSTPFQEDERSGTDHPDRNRPRHHARDDHDPIRWRRPSSRRRVLCRRSRRTATRNCRSVRVRQVRCRRDRPFERVLASLLHTAFIYAKDIKGCHRIVIEVNPRHVRFYERMLGFVTLAGERRNLRVEPRRS